MTKMSCPIKKDSLPRKSDLKCSERDHDDNDDHFLSAILQRKDGKCNSPTSSKESHSDRESDLEDSNSEFHGRLSHSYVNLISLFRVVMWSGCAKTLYFDLRKLNKNSFYFWQTNSAKVHQRRNTGGIARPSRHFNFTNLNVRSRNPTTLTCTHGKNLLSRLTFPKFAYRYI